MVSSRIDLTENRIFGGRRTLDLQIFKKKLPWLEKIEPTFKAVNSEYDLSHELGFAIYGPLDRPFFVGTFEEINKHKEYLLMHLSDMGYNVPVCENCGDDLNPIRYVVEKRRLCKRCASDIHDTYSWHSLYNILTEHKNSRPIHSLFNGIVIQPVVDIAHSNTFRNVWRAAFR